MNTKSGFFDATCEDLALFSGTPVPAVLPTPRRRPAPRQLPLDEDLAVCDDRQDWGAGRDDPGPLWG